MRLIPNYLSYLFKSNRNIVYLSSSEFTVSAYTIKEFLFYIEKNWEGPPTS